MTHADVAEQAAHVSHADSLILTLVGGFVLAFLFGMLANRLKLSPSGGLSGRRHRRSDLTPAASWRTPNWRPQLAEIGGDPADVRGRVCISRSPT
jgi:hypothetical protein